MYKRSQALKGLPGPKYPFLLGFMELVERKDVHRYATELAEQFGPLFKFRIMCFHVRPISMKFLLSLDILLIRMHIPCIRAPRNIPHKFSAGRD